MIQLVLTNLCLTTGACAFVNGLPVCVVWAMLTLTHLSPTWQYSQVVQMRTNRVQSHFSNSSMATSPTNSPAKASRWKRTITRCRERRYSCGGCLFIFTRRRGARRWEEWEPVHQRGCEKGKDPCYGRTDLAGSASKRKGAQLKRNLGGSNHTRGRHPTRTRTPHHINPTRVKETCEACFATKPSAQQSKRLTISVSNTTVGFCLLGALRSAVLALSRFSASGIQDMRFAHTVENPGCCQACIWERHTQKKTWVSKGKSHLLPSCNDTR